MNGIDLTIPLGNLLFAAFPVALGSILAYFSMRWLLDQVIKAGMFEAHDDVEPYRRMCVWLPVACFFVGFYFAVQTNAPKNQLQPARIPSAPTDLRQVERADPLVEEVNRIGQFDDRLEDEAPEK